MVASASPSGCACCLARVGPSRSVCYPGLALAPHVGLLTRQLPLLRAAHSWGACSPLHSDVCTHPVDARTHCASSRCQVRLPGAASPPSAHPCLRLPCGCGTWQLSSAARPSTFSIGQGGSSSCQACPRLRPDWVCQPTLGAGLLHGCSTCVVLHWSMDMTPRASFLGVPFAFGGNAHTLPV